MNIKKIELKIKYQNELDNINSICLDTPNYIFKHKKTDLTIEFLQKNNIKFPKIAQIILLYLLYNEKKEDYKYIINYFFKHLNFTVTDNLLFIFQFFTTSYILDLSEKEKNKINNKLETYIIKYFSFLLNNINDIETITYIFDLFFRIFQRNQFISKKIFFNIIFKYFNRWIQINNTSGIYLTTFDTIINRLDNYILINILKKYWKNKRKLTQFAKKYYKY